MLRQVSWQAFSASRMSNNEIIELIVLEDHPAPDKIIDSHLAFERILEPNYRAYALTRLSTVTTAALVTCLFASLHLSGTKVLQVFFAAVAMVGLALVEPLLDNFLISIEPI